MLTAHLVIILVAFALFALGFFQVGWAKFTPNWLCGGAAALTLLLVVK